MHRLMKLLNEPGHISSTAVALSRLEQLKLCCRSVRAKIMEAKRRTAKKAQNELRMFAPDRPSIYSPRGTSNIVSKFSQPRSNESI